MTCAQAEDEIEALAAGEHPADEGFRRHVEGCVRCASALAAARRLESALAAWPAPAAPPRFTAAVASRIRSERWRSEQQVDRVFNAFLLLGLFVIVGGIAALLNVSAVAAAASHAIEFLTSAGERTAAPAPSLVTYIVGTAFFGTALAAWWWAERRFSA
jgi:anti-sigma factor RsiW